MSPRRAPARPRETTAGGAPKPASTVRKRAPRSGAAASASAAGPAAPGAGKLLVRVTHPERVYWPDEGYTKLDLLRFYALVFPRLAPYLRDRLLSLERCPEGLRGECFFQKEAPTGLPPGTPTKRIAHEKKPVNYVVGGKRETQLALANLGCIAIHVWGSRASSPRKPDWVCFDLDPASGGFADAARAALRLKQALDALEIVSFAKTSGGRGLHVFVPLRVGPDCDEVKDFAMRLGAVLARDDPRHLTVEARVAARGDRVYLDAFRNGYAQTVVAPYSVRPLPKAPVSTPLDWSEVDPSLDPTGFNLGSFARRYAKADPWKDFFRRRQSLAPAMRALERLG